MLILKEFCLICLSLILCFGIGKEHTVPDLNSTIIDQLDNVTIKECSKRLESDPECLQRNTTLNLTNTTPQTPQSQSGDTELSFFSKDKSKLYSMIVAATHSTFGRSQFSCRRKCNKSETRLQVCSCTPLCYLYKSCCYDFLDECGHLTSVDAHSRLSNYNMPEGALTDCIDNFWVISSCRNEQSSSVLNTDNSNSSTWPKTDKAIKSGNASTYCTFFPDIEFSGSVLSAGLGSNNKYNNSFAFVSFVDYLQCLSVRVHSQHINISQLSPFQAFLLSWPIRDGKTGLIYRNKTVYDCYDANLYSMTLLDLHLDIFSEQGLTNKVISSLDTLQGHINLTTRRSVAQSEGSHEPCIPDMISECTESFEDKFVKEACRRIFLPITSIVKDGNSTKPLKYKNPFCLVCHNGVENSLNMEKVSFNLSMGHLQFYVSSTNDKVYVETRYSSFAWTKLSCQVSILTNWLEENNVHSLYSDSHELDVLGMNNGSHTGSTSEPGTQNGYVKHECRQVKCRNRKPPPCFIDKATVFMLPPTNTGSSKTTPWLRELQDGLKNIMYQLNGPILKMTTQIRTQPRELSGLDIAYTVVFSFQLELNLFLANVSYVFRDLIYNSSFPFQDRNRYFCHSYKVTETGYSCFNIDTMENMYGITATTGVRISVGQQCEPLRSIDLGIVTVLFSHAFAIVLLHM